MVALPDTYTDFKALLDSAYLYLDLEVDSAGEIYQLGLTSSHVVENCTQEKLACVYQQLVRLKQSGLSICGHNFRRFDYPHLLEQRPDFHSWWVIDTLELSILAHPLQTSHKLNKEYKQSQYAGNNPLEDARATRLLIHQLLTVLLQKPQELLQVYIWLLTCGTEDADLAYQQLFKTLGWQSNQVPALGTLPSYAIAGLDVNYLQNFWKDTATQNFDSRLCLAGLLAWNYECHAIKSAAPFSNWLVHLPGFQQILDGVRPLMPNEFTYQPYLERFGIREFRHVQEEAVQAILNGQRPLVLMATGGGKSLCYQLPALMLFERQKALTVVVSPLQALMADQVADLENEGFNFATFINGNLTAQERQERLEQLQGGSKGLLYISPEQLRSISIRTLLQERPPKLWVIDEAHCISQWGHAFRPDYRYIPKFIQELYQERQLPMPLLTLLTATATVAVRDDIKNLFAKYGLEIGREVVSSSLRDNLEYRVIPVNGNKEQTVIQEVQQALGQGGCVLVYTTTRKNAEKLATLLKQANIDARHYHGKLTKTEKDEVLRAFRERELNVVVATCAFGMGINRKDVRAVIHHTMSANLEGYVQEAGRAGRDEQPATCTLLFDEKDADTIFFLQSLNQLSDTDLRNIFVSTRSLRDRIPSSSKVSEDWFWVTTNEIFQTSDLDEEFASEQEQRDTKIKVALHNLENFGLIERAENLSTFIQFEMVHRSLQESLRQFENYSQVNNLPAYQIEQFKRLIYAMHLAKAYYKERDESFPLDRLSDEAGIASKELTSRIRELQKAGICSFEIPLTLLVTKGVKGDARRNHERIRALEQELLEILLQIPSEKNTIQVNLRGLASHLDPGNIKKVRASTLMDILEGWSSQKWVVLSHVGRDVVRLKEMEVVENLSRHQKLARAVIEVLYEKLSDETGVRLRLEYELGQLLKDVIKQTQPLTWSEKDLDAVLLWLHQRKLIRLTNGFNFLQQALKVKVIKNKKWTTITHRYPEVKAHYDEQTRRTHLMVKYGKTNDESARQKLVEDYFGLSPSQFSQTYSELATEATKRPVTQDDYNRIMGDLNPTQKAIVLDETPALAVIAGPGSGKTRTIVHRIAYLVKVKRVDPARILVLAYNRNAVRELRLRLQNLVGPLASRLRVFTFHSLALALLGRTLSQQRRSREVDFTQLLQEACQLIEQGDELDDSDTQARRIQLLGNVEYIFVDEYQDVAKDEYRLIQLIAGLGDSEDLARSVQINLCVIGDDDQNIYEFNGTSPEYIIQFETEYKAKRLLLTENYRSTEPIIEAANNLIQNNRQRCKQKPAEQVRIDSQRKGSGGLPVKAFTFGNPSQQAAWVKQQIQSWINSGIAAKDIAVLARRWQTLEPIRALLEKQGIATYALKGEGIKLVRNRVTSQLLDELKAQSHRIFSPQESIRDWMTSLFIQWNRSLQEPTAKTLLKIASDLDQERGYGAEELAVPMSADEILTAVFEFNESGELFLEDNAVLVTSCHGAKGLEFRKVVLLTDGFNSNYEVESERRLFYVAMTRAEEELILCSTNSSLLVHQTGASSQRIAQANQSLPQLMLYWDLTPGDVHLGYAATKNQQVIIQNLREGTPLQMKTNRFGDGWIILTQQGHEIGKLSRWGAKELAKKQIQLGQFQFQLGEVTVKSIYRHLEIDDVTGNVREDWFVVIPQIRVCR